MIGEHPLHLPFEIECHRHKDQMEFCRIFFQPTSVFPKSLLFGMDDVRFDSTREFREANAGMVVNRSDKLILYVGNKRSRQNTRLSIDLDPYWPTDINPGEVKVRLAEIDIAAAIKALI